jgi:hypothetical protein
MRMHSKESYGLNSEVGNIMGTLHGELWSQQSPIIVVPMKDGTWRMCIN